MQNVIRKKCIKNKIEIKRSDKTIEGIKIVCVTNRDY